jgi:hypothetical protein
MGEKRGYHAEVPENELRLRLEDYLADLKRLTSDTRPFLYASPGAAKSAMEKIVASQNNDRTTISSDELRAAIYGQADTAAHFEAFRVTNAVASIDAVEVGLFALDRQKVGIALSMFRALIERAGAAAYIVRKCNGILTLGHRGDSKPIDDWQTLIDLAQPVSKTLYGTRRNWAELVQADFSEGGGKRDRYQVEAGNKDLESNSVMNFVDEVNKEIAGVRRVYELLCEFAHPNVGDLFSATAEFHITTDRKNLRFYKRIIRNENRNSSMHPDFDIILGKIYQFMVKIIENHTKNHDILSRYSLLSLNIAQNYIANVVRRNSHAFRRDDICPCLSGKMLYQCCGRRGTGPAGTRDHRSAHSQR